MGRARIARLGLSNIELLWQDLMDVTPDIGDFDYIICHGVYSWVPQDVRQKILRICRDHLAPQGVAYVSYNTNPGWRMRGILRDLMAYHTRETDDPRRRVAAVRELLAMMGKAIAGGTDAYAALIREELARLAKAPDAHLAHEQLEEVNDPCYFDEFVDRAVAAGLQFLAEADPRSMTGDELRPEARDALRALGGTIEREQYLDFVRNTRFRKTLLCHGEQTLGREFSLERFRRLYLASQFDPPGVVEVEDGSKATFRRGQFSVTTSDRVVKAALWTLCESAPARFQFDALLDAALGQLGVRRDAAGREAITSKLVDVLLLSYLRGAIQLFSRPIDFAARAGPRPMARPLARLVAQEAESEPIPSYLNQRVPVGALGRRLIPLLDGTRDRRQLIEEVRKITAENPADSDAAASDPEAVLENELLSLARSSLLFQ
jgi:methyltransferase-like protein